MAITCPEVGVAPEPNSILWRYMELDRFKSLLERKALFFSRADKFPDQFEGSLPLREYEFRPKVHRAIDDFYGNQSTDEQIAESIAGLTHEHLEFRRRHVVNCWHSNSNESDAMWGMYLKSNEGIAIQTSVSRLRQSVETSPLEVEISKVRYLDYERDIFFHATEYPHRNYNLMMPLLHKRNEFIHEKEVRLIHEVREAYSDKKYWETQEFETGMFIEVDIPVLVRKVILTPTSDERVREKVELVIQNAGYHFTIEKSALSRPALF